MEASGSGSQQPFIVPDGSLERDNDPEELAIERARQASVASFKQEQCERDAALARMLAAECSSSEESPMEAEVVPDGSIERENDPDELLFESARQESLQAS